MLGRVLFFGALGSSPASATSGDLGRESLAVSELPASRLKK